MFKERVGGEFSVCAIGLKGWSGRGEHIQLVSSAMVLTGATATVTLAWAAPITHLTLPTDQHPAMALQQGAPIPTEVEIITLATAYAGSISHHLR